MATNSYQPPGTEKSGWPQFSLRSLLIIVAALALLFAQWPFIEEREIDLSDVPMSVMRKADGTVDEEVMAALGPPVLKIAYFKNSFLAVLFAETGLVVGWFLLAVTKKRSVRLTRPGA